MGKKTENVEDKKLKIEILEANLKNTDRELNTIAEAKKEIEEKLVLIREQQSLRTQMHRLALKHFKPINPAWEFQKDPEYVALQAKMSENEFAFKAFEIQNVERQILNNIKSYEEQLKSQTEAKERILKNIEELRG